MTEQPIIPPDVDPAGTEARFWAKTVAGPTEDDCVIWVGAIADDGYARFWTGPTERAGPVLRAHRYAYQLRFGHLPKGVMLKHSCDITVCVNAKHLAVGTDRQNRIDRSLRRNSYPGLPMASGLRIHTTRADVARKIRADVLAHGYDRDRLWKIITGLAPETPPLF